MCNHAELLARQSALNRIDALLGAVVTIVDVDARRVLVAEIREITGSLQQVIEVKLQAEQSGIENGDNHA